MTLLYHKLYLFSASGLLLLWNPTKSFGFLSPKPQISEHFLFTATSYSVSDIPTEHHPLASAGDDVDSFRSDPLKVYIEYTDAFGIIYNGNYLRFYERALLESQLVDLGTPINKNASDTRTKDLTKFPHDNWSIVGLKEQKFKSSPLLGQCCVVEGTRTQVFEGWEMWNVMVTSCDGSIIYNTVTGLVLARVQNKRLIYEPLANLPDMPDPFPVGNEAREVESFKVYRDELDPSWEGILPIRSVLNLFERIRSNFLGGPDALREMKDKHNLVWVVSKIEDAFLTDDVNLYYFNATVNVETQFQVLRKGMIIDCYQTLKKKDGRQFAQAKIQIVAVNEKTGRPTSKIPSKLAAKLGVEVS